MNEQNLFSVHLRYQRCLTDSCKSRGEGFSNLLKNVVITEPFQALSGDITYIPTDEGFEYPYTKTGMILAGKTADRMKKGLILATRSSLKKRRKLPSESFSIRIVAVSVYIQRSNANDSKMGMRQSFSHIGMPGDNSRSESFYSIMKKELIFQLDRFPTRKVLGKVCFNTLKAFITRAGARNVLVIPILINVCKTGL